MRLPVLVLLATALMFSACGPKDGEEPETPLEYGFEKTEEYACGESFILDALLDICNRYATCTKTVDRCWRVTQELFAGTTLRDVENAPATYWNSFGGRGELMAESSLCMLKELARNGGVKNQATARLFEIFPVSVKQKLGFLKYDPMARTMDGYQDVNICLPIVGCFTAKESTFHAELKQRSPARPRDLSCGNFPIEDSFALRMTAETSKLAINIKVPDININTPYGPIVVKPMIDYYSDLHAILFPILGETYANVDDEHQTIHLHDVYGRIPGVGLEVNPKDLTPSGAPLNTGWSSQLGLGGRQPNPNTPQWKKSEDPFRPDFDQQRARNDIERQPTIGAKAEVKVTYRPPLPAALTDGDPMTTIFEVMAKPLIRAHYSSQFNIFFNEFTSDLRDAGSSLLMSSALMASHASAYASFEIEAGIDLFIKFTSRFFTKEIVNIKPRVNLIIAQNGDKDEKTVGAATTQYDPRFSPTPLLDGFTTNASGAQRNPTDYVKECVKRPEPEQPKPVAEFVPGNPDILEHTEFPCNICVGHEAVSEGNTFAEAYSTLVYPSVTGPLNWTCNEYHAGCFDMCAFDPATNALTVTRTALTLGVRGMPRNVACNENPPR